MKQYLLFIFIFNCALAFAQSNQAYEHNVSMLLSNISLEEALSKLSAEYNVDFSYSDDIVPTQSIINLNLENATLHYALNTLLSPFQIKYRITGKRVILKKSSKSLTPVIRGVVTDEFTNTPIPGATLIIDGITPQVGTITDEHGKFKFTQMPVGVFKMNVSFIGYNTKLIDNINLGTAKELVLEIKLSELITPMNEIVVLALRSASISGEGSTLTSSRTLLMEDTKRFAGSLNDPVRMLNATEAGVTGANDGYNALVIRGNSPRGLLWRVEGMEVSDPNHFAQVGCIGGSSSVFSPNVIQSIDLMTGAFPTQYGNALAGIYDVKLRNGNNELRKHSIQMGLLGAEVCTEGPFSKNHGASYLINYRHTTSSIVQKLGYDLDEVNAGRLSLSNDLTFKINYPLKRSGTLSLFGVLARSTFYKAVTTSKDTAISYYNYHTKNNFDMGMVGLNYHYMLNNNTSIEAKISHSKTYNYIRDSTTTRYNIEEQNSIKPPPFYHQEKSENKDNFKSYVRGALSIKRKINRNYSVDGGLIFSYAGHYYLTSTNTNTDSKSGIEEKIQNTPDNSGNTTTTQGYLSLKQNLSPSVFAYYGIHYINYAYAKDHTWEPRAGLQWQISQRNSLSAAFGKHSKIDEERYYLDQNIVSPITGMHNRLKFTRAYHYNLSYKQLLLKRHLLKLELYYQRLYSVPVNAGNEDKFFYTNLNEEYYSSRNNLTNNGKGRNYGVELSIEKSFSNNFYYLINGSLYESKFDIGDNKELNTIFNGNYSFHILAGKDFVFRNHSRFGLNIKLVQLGGRRTEFYLKDGVVSYDLQKAYTNQVPAYFRADLQLSYTLNIKKYTVQWRLDLNNVTNHSNATNSYYDFTKNSYQYPKQPGFLPLLSCRVDF